MTLKTPVVLLGFNRPDMTSRVFEAIRQVRPEQLLLVMDGPRTDVSADAELVRKTRQVCQIVDWPCAVTEIFSPVNLGLKRRISSGLDEVFQTVDRAIILEDDCVPDHSFFRFAEEMLDRFLDQPRVGLVSGSSRLRGHRASEYSYDFSRDVRIWGWATWARTWNGFRASGDLDASWSQPDQEAIMANIALGARRRAMNRMLDGAKELDSWALPFVVHCQKQGYLNVVPEVNLIENIGFGARSTHTKFEDFVSQVPAEQISFPLTHPDAVAPNFYFDELESRLDAREWWLYPLRHPWDVSMRVLRFVASKFRP